MCIIVESSKGSVNLNSHLLEKYYNLYDIYQEENEAPIPWSQKFRNLENKIPVLPCLG